MTKSGEATQTYDISSSTNRIIGSTHIEQEWSQIASFAIDSDTTLAGLSLKGYTGTISYGYNDATNGDEYSACAPLEVMVQPTSTLLNRAQSQLVTSFTLVGVFDMMSADRASADHKQESDDTRTVKTLLTAIAGGTLAPFSHCKSYTITFDPEDSLINSYIPADYFSVSAGESRLSSFRKLIGTTKCKARIEADGAIHIFNPTISGSSYDYQYNDAVTNHNFFEKETRSRLVIPNKMLVSSHPKVPVAEQFSGNAVDASSYSALGRYIDSRPHYIRATSDAQCTAIATALLQQLQVDSERGHGIAFMNCGQEVMDYVLITDSVASDTRAGNIGYIKRDYTPGKKFSMEFRFGRLAAEMPFMSFVGDEAAFLTQADWDEMKAYIKELNDLLADWVASIDTVPKWHVRKELRIPEAYN